MLIAKVLIEHPVASLDTPFDYQIPDGMVVREGTRVRVAFGHQDSLVGYVLQVVNDPRTQTEIETEQGFELKAVLEVFDAEAILNVELRELAQWLAYTTVTPLIACFQTMLPPSLKPNSSKKVAIKQTIFVRVINADTTGLTPKQSACLSSLNPQEVYAKGKLEWGAAITKKLIETGHLEQFAQEVYRNPLDTVYTSS